MSNMAEPRLLIVETSGRSGEVALAEGGKLLGVRQLHESRRHGRDLAPTVAELLREQDWRANEINGVIVSRGPGSYTGLRIGIMSAKVFAYATGCALIAVDTFAAIAEQAPEPAQQLEILADAQQDKVYVQPFGRVAGAWQPLAPLAIRSFTDWLSQCAAEAWVTGPGLHKWESKLPGTALRVDNSRREPAAGSLLRLGLARYLADQRDDLWTLEPLYLRPSSAEEQWQARAAPP